MALVVPDVINRYFEADANGDIDTIVDLFTDDAIVVDEGETRHGPTEIRAWQQGPASKYEYTTTLLGIEQIGDDQYDVTGRLDGNFPGGTVDLRWHFTVARDRISELRIAP